MYKKLLKAVAVMLALSISISMCGCTSIFTDIVPEVDVDEDNNSDQVWNTATYGSEIITTYPSGKDAFYVDEEKCIKSEIEEFHLLSLSNDKTLYYFTAPTNPEYQGNDTNTGYYCLATYDYENNIYTPLEEGFYKKEAGSVSMASDFNDTGTGFACIGDTFLYITNMSILYKFILSEDDKAKIKEDVGGEYLCFDIALVSVFEYRITASFMCVPSAGSDAEEEDELKSTLYQITFSDDPATSHTLERISKDLDGSVGNLCTSFKDGSEINGSIYVYGENEEEEHLVFNNYLYNGNQLKQWFDFNLEAENLTAFTGFTDSSNNSILMMVFEDQLELWKIEINSFIDSYPYMYTNVTTIRLDDSPSYMSVDETPSIVVNSSDMIYTCSLTKGFRQFTTDSNGKVKTTTFAKGAYYAAYSADGNNCTLVGFNTANHKRTTNTYKNGKLSSSVSKDEEYTMNDLPYAKIYYTQVGDNNFAINSTNFNSDGPVTAKPVGGEGAPPPPDGTD